VQLAFQSVLAAAFLLIASVADAGPFEDGEAAYQRHDYTTALQVWRPLADQGDPLGQNALGVLYSQGQGVTQDYAEAVKWYRKPAVGGSPLRKAISPTCIVKGRASRRIMARLQDGMRWRRNKAMRGRNTGLA
jgi:TPR repeat protein